MSNKVELIDDENINQLSQEDQDNENETIVYEYKIEGMTCVACSSAIERGIKNEFKDKGLVYDQDQKRYMVNVILLLHKMKVTFYKQKSQSFKVNGKLICDEVEDLGFGCQLVNTFELQQEQ